MKRRTFIGSTLAAVIAGPLAASTLPTTAGTETTGPAVDTGPVVTVECDADQDYIRAESGGAGFLRLDGNEDNLVKFLWLLRDKLWPTWRECPTSVDMQVLNEQYEKHIRKYGVLRVYIDDATMLAACIAVAASPEMSHCTFVGTHASVLTGT